MGISISPLHFLAHTQGTLGKTLTLGHQDNNLPKQNPALVQAILQSAGRDINIDSFIHEKYADELLRQLGATQVLSMDASDYEQADFVHDLNKPIPESYWGQFDTIIDGGTLEHVYHLPNALTNIAKMLKVGGRFLSMSIANNWLGHGFYQFSPELMWRYCKGFGFQVNRIDLYVRTQGIPEVFSVPDPETEGRRLEMKTPPNPIDLMTDAIKTQELYPDYLYQSDYSSTWQASEEKTK